MSNSLPVRIRAFISRHRTQICVPLVLLLLTLMSYCICGQPAADALLVPEWGTRYLLLPTALGAILLSVLRLHLLSLSAFIGYHAGLVLAVVGTDAGTEQLVYGQVTVILTLTLVLILGAWAEVFSRLLPKWRGTSRAEETD